MDDVTCMQVVLSTPAPLVPPHLASRDPEYYVLSGLVFTAASEPYLASEYGADFLSLAPVALLDKVRISRSTVPTMCDLTVL